jgi:hypothetical protein
VRYFVWEGITLDAGPPTELPQVELRRATFQQLVEEVRRHQAAGALPQRLDPHQLTFFLYVLGVYPYLLPQMAYLITGHVPAEEEFRSSYEAFLRDLANVFDSVGVSGGQSEGDLFGRQRQID